MPDWKEINGFVGNVNKLCYYVSHPKQLGIMVWNWFIPASFFICLSVCLIGLVLYLMGIKKGAYWSKFALFLYLTIQIFNWVI